MEENNIEKINALAVVLSSMKNTFIKDRDKKDEIVELASDALLKELRNLD